MSGILLFNGCYTPPFDEGVKLVVHHLRNELAQLTPVHMVTTAEGAPPDVTVIPKETWGFIREVRRLCHTHCPETILYVPDAYLRTMSAARCVLFRLAAGSIPLGLITLQPNEFNAATRLMLRLRRPDVVFAQVIEETHWYDRYGIRYLQLPPAVDTEKFRPVASREQKKYLRIKHGIPADKKVFLHVGHIRQSRNIEWLLRLTLPSEAHLVVVGSSSRTLDKELKRILVEKGATVLDGYFADIEEIYQLADIYLFPVIQQDAAIDMPLSVLEAMACNLAVVTTAFRAMSKTFGHVPGLHLVTDEYQFQDAVLKTLGDKKPQTRDAVESLSWQKCAAEILRELRRS